jgi:hypothetical protein
MGKKNKVKVRKNSRFTFAKARHKYLSSFFTEDAKLNLDRYIKHLEKVEKKSSEFNVLTADHKALLVEIINIQKVLVLEYGYLPDNFVVFPDLEKNSIQSLYETHFCDLIDYLNILQKDHEEKEKELTEQLDQAIEQLNLIKDENIEPDRDKLEQKTPIAGSDSSKT